MRVRKLMYLEGYELIISCFLSKMRWKSACRQGDENKNNGMAIPRVEEAMTNQ